MSWVGGKKALREEVVQRFPLYYERYIEVFGGGGWVLFHKPPGRDFEVYNDFNSLLANLYRCVRDKPDLLMNALKYVLNSREDFDRVRLALRRQRTTDVQRAAWFYQIIRYSYASALTSYGSQPHDMRANFLLIEQAHRRLKDVVVEMVRKDRSPFWVALGEEKLEHFLNRRKFDAAAKGWYYSQTRKAVLVKYPNPGRDINHGIAGIGRPQESKAGNGSNITLTVSFEDFDLIGM